MRPSVKKRKNEAQLLLVTCILLSLALLTVAIISVQIATKPAEVANTNARITDEYAMVKGQFGTAVEALANQKMEETTTPDFSREAITLSVEEAGESFNMIEARHGLSFDSHFDPKTGFVNNQNPYKIRVTISLASDNTQIVEEHVYEIRFMFKE